MEHISAYYQRLMEGSQFCHFFWLLMDIESDVWCVMCGDEDMLGLRRIISIKWSCRPSDWWWDQVIYMMRTKNPYWAVGKDVRPTTTTDMGRSVSSDHNQFQPVLERLKVAKIALKDVCRVQQTDSASTVMSGGPSRSQITGIYHSSRLSDSHDRLIEWFQSIVAGGIVQKLEHNLLKHLGGGKGRLETGQ